ncbi:hypothetical protein RRG08_056866 [Elysia crispata]|uniref:Uncharacterized protein n=1 Tax=Elysia crispata TaxID=231223 RepID=A0AAE1DES5_9GAST|nr:hypothetical protein RRG08_056866 [Elysia crispata]
MDHQSPDTLLTHGLFIKRLDRGGRADREPDSVNRDGGSGPIKFLHRLAGPASVGVLAVLGKSIGQPRTRY